MFFNVRGVGLFGTRDGDFLRWNGNRRLADVALNGPARGDLASPVRTCFGDAALSGTFTLESGVLAWPLVFCARVSDRTLPAGWPPRVDQDSVRVELTPGSGQLVAFSTKDGIETRIGSATVPAMALGSSHGYLLKTDGNALTFELDGAVLIQATGDLPAKGYFQWKLPYGLHLHLDDIAVDLPGATVAPPAPAPAPVPAPDPTPLPDPEPVLR